MRKYKFRGKSINSGNWVYGYYFFNGTEHGIVDNIGFPGQWRQVFPETVGEYTGLSDQNLKEVYEGDKVLCLINEEVIGADDEIVFKNEAFWLNRRNRPLYEWFEVEVGTIEVIGNIYEPQTILT